MLRIYATLLLFSTGTLFGQQIKIQGTFLNLENNQAIEDLHVVMDQIKVGVSTDDQGKFEILIDSLRELGIYDSRLGFTGLTIKIDEDFKNGISIGSLYFLRTGISGYHTGSKRREKKLYRKNLKEKRPVELIIKEDGPYYIFEINKKNTGPNNGEHEEPL